MTRTPPALITLILLTGFAPLSLNMFMPSLAGMAVDLGTDYATISLAVSGYLAITAGVQLILGPLSDRIGRRPVVLIALGTFTLASVGCVMARDVQTFLAFRMLQAGMVAGYTMAMAIVRDTRDAQAAVSLIGYIGMAMAVAPMLGPVLGGVLDQAFGWRATFITYAAMGAGLFLLAWFDLGETRVRATASRAPARALLRTPLFWAYALCGAFSVGAFYIFITGVPLVAVSTFGVTTAQLGALIGSITVGFMAGSFVTGRLGCHVRGPAIVIAGRVVACTGLGAALALWGLGVTSPWAFFAGTMCVGFGNGLTMPGSMSGAMSARPDLAGTASGLMGALIVAGGAVLTALTGAVLPEVGGAPVLLALMLGSSLAGLALAFWAGRLSARLPPA
ncbi:MAG: multidrug effflux MFS transporter [Pseudomonadota bacterium]